MNPFKSQDYNINELTNGNDDGSLDILLASLKKHLWAEYEHNRIRGTDYANAYIDTIKHGLAQIMSYSLERAKLPLELQILEAQVQKLATDTIVATKQGGLIDAQIYKEMAETARIQFDIQHRLPKELELMQVKLDNDKIELALKDYELRYLKPEQLALAKAELRLKEKQVTLAEKEIEVKLKELSLKAKQIEMAQYELDYKLPAEVRSVNAQAELYAQKVITEQAQTSGSPIGAGSVIDHNNKVLEQQAISYKNDAKIKVANIYADMWKTARNTDPDATAFEATWKNKIAVDIVSS